MQRGSSIPGFRAVSAAPSGRIHLCSTTCPPRWAASRRPWVWGSGCRCRFTACSAAWADLAAFSGSSRILVPLLKNSGPRRSVVHVPSSWHRMLWYSGRANSQHKGIGGCPALQKTKKTSQSDWRNRGSSRTPGWSTRHRRSRSSVAVVARCKGVPNLGAYRLLPTVARTPGSCTSACS